VEEEYKLLDFGAALALVKEGLRLSRAGWNGKDMWIEAQFPDAHSKMSLPYIYMKTAQGDLVPWLASQTDLMAEDWVLVPQFLGQSGDLRLVGEEE